MVSKETIWKKFIIIIIKMKFTRVKSSLGESSNTDGLQMDKK